MSFGQLLKKARKDKGYTMRKLAEKCGFSQNTVYYYESDRIEPTFFKLTCICDVLGISLDGLAKGQIIDKPKQI